MDTEKTELKGFSKYTDNLRDVARHEAGHALMLWLLDQHLFGIFIRKEGGMTRRLEAEGNTMGMASHYILYILAGMIMEQRKEAVEELHEHADDSGCFDQRTDSYFVAKALENFEDPPLVVLSRHEAVIRRCRRRFARQFNELVDILLHRSEHALVFNQAYELFAKWDIMAGFDKRPKSDFVMRALAREFGWRLPRCKWIGWDMEPLPPDWEPRPKRTLEEIIKIVGKELAGNAGLQDE